MKKIAMIGFGSWGTALAVLLAGKGAEVFVTARNKEWLKTVDTLRENRKYLPGVQLPPEVCCCTQEKEALQGASLVIFAVPAQHFRANLTASLPYLEKDAVILNVSKGIEQGTLMLLSAVAREIAPGHPFATLSGPSHAEEVGVGIPTTVAVSATVPSVAEDLQELFRTERFRVYTNDDLIGVELGGALKNIIALASGISDGLGFGDNTKAALMTRGIEEIKRLGVALGAREKTFYGLTGIGDLIVTCTSLHSRNLRCGRMIGQGLEPHEAMKRIGMVVEGVYTCAAAHDLAARVHVEMPITESLRNCLNGSLKAQDALGLLMNRSPKRED